MRLLRTAPGILAALTNLLRTSAVLTALMAAWAPASSQAAVLQQTSPTPTTYTEGVDFEPMFWSGTGDVTAGVIPVDLDLSPPIQSTSACESSDFAGFPAGSIALIQRSGVCLFSTMVDNATAAGAVGAIIFNEGDTPERTGLVGGTLLFEKTIPVVFGTFALGSTFASITGLQVHMVVTLADDIRPVPEPGGLALTALGVAALGLAGLAHRQAARRSRAGG